MLRIIRADVGARDAFGVREAEAAAADNCLSNSNVGISARFTALSPHWLTLFLERLPTEIHMHTRTAEEMMQYPRQLIDDARRGEPTIVTVAGEPVLMTLPLGKELDSRAIFVDLAATLFDLQQISLGLAAQIADLSYREMVDELGRRNIDVTRLEPGAMERELASFED